MDLTDIKILDFLQDNSNITVKELAEKLNLTPTPVYERIKKLEKGGYIKKYVALLNAQLLGKDLTVFINISINDHHLKSRQEFLIKMKEFEDIIELYHTSGNYDFIAKVKFNNITEYRNFLVNKISCIDNINRIDSQIVLEEIYSSTKVLLR